MISWLKDLPEPLVGAAAAVAVWGTFNYAVLAPRSMELHMQADVYPDCQSQLLTAQEASIQRASEAAHAAREEGLDRLYENELRLSTYDQTMGIYEQMGLGAIMRHYGNGGVLGQAQAQAERIRAANDAARAALSELPDFDRFRASAGDLLAVCACAGLEAIAGVRMDHTIHTATFRLVGTDSLATLRNQVSEIAGDGRSCGQLPWQALEDL